MEKQEAPQEAFDLRVHIRGKDGLIETVQPYRLSIKGGKKRYMRGGRVFSPDGTEIVTAETKKRRLEYDRKVAAKKVELLNLEAKKQVEREMEEKAIEEVNLEMAEEKANLEATPEVNEDKDGETLNLNTDL